MREHNNADAERIKAALDDPFGLLDALGLLGGRRGVDWERQPSGVTIRCLWHSENSPSCSVTRVRDGVRAWCFSCHVSADGLGIVAAALGLDVRTDYARVLDHAAELAGVPRPERLDRAPYHPLPAIVRRPVPVHVEAPEDGSIDAVAAVLADLAPVAGDRAALGYLAGRGLGGSRVARGWYALPGDEAARARLRDAIVERVGAEAWASSGLSSVEGPREGLWSYAWHGPRVVIPWRAPNGTVESLQGRLMGAESNGVRKYVFPRGRRPRWPFGAEDVADLGADTAIAVVEGALDAVSFNLLARAAGADAYALAIPGVSAWDARWLRFFARRPCVVGLDADRAGEALVAEMRTRLASVARRDANRRPMVSVKRPRTGKDWNEALAAQPAARARAEVA